MSTFYTDGRAEQRHIFLLGSGTASWMQPPKEWEPDTTAGFPSLLAALGRIEFYFTLILTGMTLLVAAL